MEKKFKSPRGGMIVFLCVVVTALWLTAVYGTYEDSQREKYEVRIKPGAVSHGTHSSVTMPAMVSPTHRSSMPMVSGSAVRSYAHHGHAAMPSAGVSSGYRMHATSSASVKTIGSGSGSGAGMGTASGTSSSSRGITYGGGSVSMPTLAVNSSLLATSSISAIETTIPRAVGPRKVHSDGFGGYEGDWSGEYLEGYGYWNAADEEWEETNEFEGAIKYEGGKTYQYQGGSWVLISDQGDPTNPQPLGATPWLMMLLFACAYALYKYILYNKK